MRRSQCLVASSRRAQQRRGARADSYVMPSRSVRGEIGLVKRESLVQCVVEDLEIETARAGAIANSEWRGGRSIKNVIDEIKGGNRG
jgi:hypothetical protein